MLKKVSIASLALLALASCSSARSKQEKMAMPMVSTKTENAMEIAFEKHANDRVFFALDSSNLSEHEKKHVHKQAEWLKSHPSVMATVEGYCDERGTREYNMALGDKRANEVKELLVSGGVDANKVSTLSFGKDKPLVSGHGEHVWKQNRAAVTVVDK